MCCILAGDYSKLIVNVGNVTFSDFYRMINDSLRAGKDSLSLFKVSGCFFFFQFALSKMNLFPAGNLDAITLMGNQRVDLISATPDDENASINADDVFCTSHYFLC